jgi:hypothetical protein
LASALAITAIHISGRAELTMLAGAVVLAGLAAITKGPLAAFRVLAPRAHRVLEVVVGAVLVLSPLASLRHPSPVGIGLLELSGLVLLRLAYVGIRPPRPPRPPRPARSSRGIGEARIVAVDDGPAVIPADVAEPVASASNSETVTPKAGSLLGSSARVAGRVTGRVRRRASEAAPVADDLLGRGARRLGTAVGRRAARKAAS